MSIWDKLRGELIDIVEWLDPSKDTMVYRFERHNNEIKNGAKLTVREGQAAVFVNEGQIADIFPPGMYELDTANLPILSTLQGWKHGFESPFKAEVYFISTRKFTDLKWGTKNPVMMRDVEFGPVRLRAFGTYCVRVGDPGTFIKEIVGTDGHFTTEDITDQLRNLIVARFTDLLGESKIPILDLAANYDELGEFITTRIHADFESYGVDVSNMLVENISLPEEVEAALDKRSSMGIVGNLQQYTQFQAANAMEAAAKNPGGDAGAGIGMGMGFAMANQMGQAMAPQAQGAGAPPPPLPHTKQFYAAINGQQAGPFDMNTLKLQASQGNITQETLVWCQGMSDWAAAGETPEVKNIFGQTPPPLPPS